MKNNQANTTEQSTSAASDCYAVGDKVRLLKNIWDCGADGHHPPYELAHKGEILIVRSGTGQSETGHLAVSHEHITDGRAFSVYAGEYERA